jgi:glycosyltransferase involved in cell wall biosynthesis
MPLFSTVIPVFNRAQLIRATLDSVLAQEFNDQEIIVVDDGSTDDTPNTLALYSDRVRVVRQENSGPAVARNRGIEIASGQYIAVLDSDDLWFPWTLATYTEAIRRFENPAFVAGSPHVFSNEEELTTIQRTPFAASCFADYLASSDQWRWFSASSFVLRTDAVRAVGGFSDAWINADDADLALRVGLAPGFVHLQAPATFAYREHAGSLKTDTDISFRSLAYLLAQEMAGAYPGGAARRRERQRILTRHIRPFTLACLRAGALAKGWSLYRKTFAWHVAEGRAAYLCGYVALAILHALKLRKPLAA